MRLRLLLPSHVVVDERVERVSAEGLHGQFTMLPRHVDGVVALVPGLLSFVVDGEETFFAVDGGTLVKEGDEVLVSSVAAARGPELEALGRSVWRSQRAADTEEDRAHGALVRIEMNLVQRFVDLEERRRA